MIQPAAKAVVRTCNAVCQLGNLNPAVQGALIAAFVALLGIGLTAFVTWQQLRHAKKEAARERVFQLKKDVLLGMLDGVGRMKLGFNKLLDLEAASTEAQRVFNEGSQLAQRAHGTASIPLIAAFMTVVEQASIAFLELLVKRHALDAIKRTLDDLRTTLHEWAATNTRSHHEEKLAPQADEIAQHMRQLEEQAQQYDVSLNTLSAAVLKAQMALYPVTQNLTALARVDLGVDRPGDSAKYIQATAVRGARVADRISEVLPSPLGEVLSNSLRDPPAQK